jgi:FHS family L-fucose permease-like MFS transporter
MQVAANPYVAVLGPSRTASSRLNLTQAFNSLGTTVAPYFGGLLILGAGLAPRTEDDIRAMTPQALHAYRLQEASSVKLPYFVIALALIALGVVIARFSLPHIPEAEGGHAVANDTVWRHPNLLLGTVAIFTYVGAEVSIGSFLVNYMNLPEVGNLRPNIAAKYLTFYWGGAMCGRFIGSAILQKVPTRVVLGFNAVVAAFLVCLSMLSFGHLAMRTLLLVGLFNSIMFPSIFTLGIEGLGPLTGEASGLLIMAIVGGAIVPELQGLLADRVGLHHAFVLPVLCYLYILFFAIKGQPRSNDHAVGMK